MPRASLARLWNLSLLIGLPSAQGPVLDVDGIPAPQLPEERPGHLHRPLLPEPATEGYDGTRAGVVQGPPQDRLRRRPPRVDIRQRSAVEDGGGAVG